MIRLWRHLPKIKQKEGIEGPPIMISACSQLLNQVDTTRTNARDAFGQLTSEHV